MWGAPQKTVLDAHPPDQGPQLGCDPGSASRISGLPAPISAKPDPVPADDGLRAHDGDGLEDRRKYAIQQDEEEAVAIGELDATAYFALQQDELLPQSGILCLKPTPGLEQSGNEMPEEDDQRDHRADDRRFCHQINPDEICGRHSRHAIG